MHGLVTPRQVAENVLRAIAASEAQDPPLNLFASHDAAHIREQAAESTRRYALVSLFEYSYACWHMILSQALYLLHIQLEPGKERLTYTTCWPPLQCSSAIAPATTCRVPDHKAYA